MGGEGVESKQEKKVRMKFDVQIYLTFLFIRLDPFPNRRSWSEMALSRPTRKKKKKKKKKQLLGGFVGEIIIIILLHHITYYKKKRGKYKQIKKKEDITLDP